MLEDLFKNNKLQYVYVSTELDKNIISDMVLNRNIENLSYFDVDVKCMRYEVVLDISDYYPEKLTVYNVLYYYNYDIDYKKYFG